MFSKPNESAGRGGNTFLRLTGNEHQMGGNVKFASYYVGRAEYDKSGGHRADDVQQSDDQYVS